MVTWGSRDVCHNKVINILYITDSVLAEDKQEPKHEAGLDLRIALHI